MVLFSVVESSLGGGDYGAILICQKTGNEDLIEKWEKMDKELMFHEYEYTFEELLNIEKLLGWIRVADGGCKNFVYLSWGKMKDPTVYNPIHDISIWKKIYYGDEEPYLDEIWRNRNWDCYEEDFFGNYFKHREDITSLDIVCNSSWKYGIKHLTDTEFYKLN